jgi:ketosteroid isomerase-like protein
VSDSPNLDLVRSIYADWERGDFFSSAEWVDPEIEFVSADGPEPSRWAGLAGMEEGTRDVLDAWEEYRVEVDEYRELDNERVLVLYRRSGRGRVSGLNLAQMQTKGAHLLHVHGGKVTKFVRYWDRDRALADLGLAPDADSP